MKFRITYYKKRYYAHYMDKILQQDGDEYFDPQPIGSTNGYLTQQEAREACLWYAEAHETPKIVEEFEV